MLRLAGATGGFQIAGNFELTAAFAQSPIINNLSRIRLPQRLTEQPLKIEGHLPPELRGTYYKSGPALRADFNNTYKHMLDGGGFVQRFHFPKIWFEASDFSPKRFQLCAAGALNH
jgi:hypothetical protein